MLERMVERAARACTVDRVVVATTVDPSDDEIAQFCRAHGIEFTRGSLQDVLDRYYQAAKQYDADVIVRLTGDCPLVDPVLIDDVVRALDQNQADFACNRLPPPFTRTFPIGLDVEAVTFNALERAWREATQKYEREHVLPYLYEVPGRFKVVQLNYKEDLGKLRWTLDTPEDLEFLRAVYAKLDNRNDFTWLEVLHVVRDHPELQEINSGVGHKTMYETDKRAEVSDRGKGGSKSAHD